MAFTERCGRRCGTCCFRRSSPARGLRCRGRVAWLPRRGAARCRRERRDVGQRTGARAPPSPPPARRAGAHPQGRRRAHLGVDGARAAQHCAARAVGAVAFHARRRGRRGRPGQHALHDVAAHCVRRQRRRGRAGQGRAATLHRFRGPWGGGGAHAHSVARARRPAHRLARSSCSPSSCPPAPIPHIARLPAPPRSFAPNNQAFDRLPNGVLAFLLANPTALDQVLTYHVVAANVSSSMLKVRAAGSASGRDASRRRRHARRPSVAATKQWPLSRNSPPTPPPRRRTTRSCPRSTART